MGAYNLYIYSRRAQRNWVPIFMGCLVPMGAYIHGCLVPIGAYIHGVPSAYRCLYSWVPIFMGAILSLLHVYI